MTAVVHLIKMISGEIQAQACDVEEIETVRATSRNSNSLMWTKFWGQAAKKTAVRRVAKLAPLAFDLWERARQIDNEDYRVTKAVVSRTDRPGSAVKAIGLAEQGDELADRIKPPRRNDATEAATEGTEEEMSYINQLTSVFVFSSNLCLRLCNFNSLT